MKLPAKISISLLEFIKHGKFDYIKLGQSKEWILNNFPDPDGFSEEFLHPNYAIWTYGNIEFHFNKQNILFLIYSDYIHELDGGESLSLDKWIVADYPKLNLTYVLTQLNQKEIDYCKSSSQFAITLSTKSGVELGFSKDLEDTIPDPNQLHLSSFSLMNRTKTA